MSFLSFVGVVGVKIVRFGDGVSDTMVVVRVYEKVGAELAKEVFGRVSGGGAEAFS